MKRLHVHLSVEDLQASVRFYSRLFAAEPTILKDDYAKWKLDDPRVNFAISNRSAKQGLDHLGIQVESEAELDQVRQVMEDAGRPMTEEEGAACCYARSNKHWTIDPDGVAWEAFHSLEDIPTYGDASAAKQEAAATSAQKSCCASTIKPDSARSCC
ncbi:glyoxalase/bleomycin resistance/dioxygenase family protein [Hahella sp. KA22]|uniref:ArsI/CadI family heavy metal resistance metalloenzyme n=1 Tax=Hahella sp. KA22 TaxID=1628392 RepID=UPI000FDCF2EE|nr:ArsI/CadI family heavy metal resistance metalloenzyme [Hahella sp. KA22]AZZ91435.1 glyoxalase/bleomycin resistance/dioxygenase family protein [Hahella sp. KA22]QAY54804.1 glyoxalase/bleomycin resistance/dioxygenase family protein [Hahella sp. KA22]